MKNISLIMSLCFASFFCFASSTTNNLKLPDSINVIVSEIAHSKVFEASGQVGIAGTPSQQNIRYNQLKKMASASELTELTNNKSAIVRLYSFIALLSKNVPIPAEMMTRMLNDKTIIVSIDGCIATEKSISSIIKENLSQSNKSKNLM